MKRFLALAATLGLTLSSSAFDIDIPAGRRPTSRASGIRRSPAGATFTQRFHIIRHDLTYDSFGNLVCGDHCRIRQRRRVASSRPRLGPPTVMERVVFVADQELTVAHGLARNDLHHRRAGNEGGDAQRLATSGPAAPATNRTRTERLIGGQWSLTYAIISFTDRTSSSVIPPPPYPATRVAVGVDQFNFTSIGMYAASRTSGRSIAGRDHRQVLHIRFGSGINNVSGCYFQINPPGSTNLSQCYSMNGSLCPRLSRSRETQRRCGRQVEPPAAVLQRKSRPVLAQSVWGDGAPTRFP